MSLTYLGSLQIGACLPGVQGPINNAQLALQQALPDLQARVNALASFNPSVGVAMPDFLALAQSILASVQAAISAGIHPPTLDTQIGMVTDLTTQLGIQMSAINANLNALLGLLSLMTAAGVHAYAYDGTRDGLATDLAGISPPGTTGTDHTNAVVLLTTIGATWSAMGQVFRVSP